MSFTGTVGKLQDVAAPAKGDSTALTGVSCVPLGTCVAVGETGRTEFVMSTVMTGVWNGRVWRLQRRLLTRAVVVTDDTASTP